MPKLTKTVIDRLTPNPARDVYAWDSETPGFGVRLMPSGRKSFIINYRTERGVQRRLVIGAVGAMTPDEARKIARERLTEVGQGRDPVSERKERRSAVTVAELCAEYLEAARAGGVTTRFRRPKRASTVAIDKGRVARHILPLLGGKIAAELTRADVQRMADAIAAGKTAATVKTKTRGVARVTGGAGTAARVVELLGGIWTWAERRGYVSDKNPAHGVATQRGQARDRILSRAELGALGKAIQDASPRLPQAAAALRLILLTGLRREEACGLRWREIDFEGSCLRLETTKTGRSTRPVGKAAIDHLRAITQMDDEFVFPNRTGDGSADLKKQIAAIFDAAGLTDARSHDARRTFATIAAELGYGDATIAELIGHAKRGVTERHYVRRPDAVLIDAASCVAATISTALDNDETTPISSTPTNDRGIN
jgi:integrase